MSFMDRIFAGKIIKDFGVLEEKSFVIGKYKKTLLLVKKRGKFKLVFKWSGFAPFGASVQYFDIGLDCIPNLLRWINEADQISRSPLAGFDGRPQR